MSLANHLWQSTAFLAAVALVTLALRRHAAETRYRLWMSASLKFLVPFSLLTGIGSRFSWRVAPVEASPVSFVFAPASPATTPHAQAQPVPWASLAVAVWAAGFLFVLLRWGARWMRVRAAIRAAEPVTYGDIAILRSEHSMEPGVFGIFRPVLLMPAGVLDTLDREHFEAIVVHELCHVRRRDNLAAALHMVVEALFWFHPLVWWLGARLVAEREMACDEEVLRSGVAAHSYAESILRVCRICLESPLPCMAGITGADLRRRVECIMADARARPLGLGKKLLLGVGAVGAVIGPFAIGVWNAPPIRAQESGGPALAFEAASIKPSKPGNGNHFARYLPGGKFSGENIGIKTLIIIAYHLQDYQVSGGPAWLETAEYDVNARPESAATRDQTRLMLQTLLAQRFHLQFHREMKEMAIEALVAAKGGLKVQPVHQDREGDGDFRAGAGHLIGQGASMADLAGMLSSLRDHPVVDMTGISGKFDMKLEWTPDRFRGVGREPWEGFSRIDPDGPDLFTAMEQELGLKLESRKGPVEILVIDGAERPTEN